MEDFLRRQGEMSAQLARANINILKREDGLVYYEYQFRMRNGQSKWAKTVYVMRTGEGILDAIEDILEVVRKIRIEAEDGER